MKRTLLFVFAIALLAVSGFSQDKKGKEPITDPMEFYKTLSDGSYAPNFTLQDINGNTYTLYDYLDQGKTVFIDFFAVWCGPCWNFMNTHALENLYKEHGPAGAPGVNANTTDDVMAFAIESSGNNANLACLQGDADNCSHPYGTQGDWITAAGDLPLLPTYSPNNAQCVNDYDIMYVPTIYKICPDRSVEEVGQLSSADDYYATVSQCPAPSSYDNDARVFSFDYPVNFPYCTGEFQPKVTIQNYGSQTLTSLQIKTYVDGNEVSSYDWSGSLDTYEIEQVTLPQVTISGSGTHTMKVEVFNPNGTTDQDNSNNSQEITVSTNPDGAHVVLDILTDNYPDETTWDIKLNGTVIASGGPFTQAQYHNIIEMCLDPSQCYDFTIYDAYGDGMSYNGVTGHVTITSSNDTLVDFNGDDFTSSKTVNFCLSNSAVEESVFEGLNVYPNPASDELTIKNAQGSRVSIVTNSGVVLLEKEIKKDNDKINTKALSNGYYILKISKEGKVITKPLVIVK
jgi:thiol-disulfide isomerase/thioredoxin